MGLAHESEEILAALAMLENEEERRRFLADVSVARRWAERRAIFELTAELIETRRSRNVWRTGCYLWCGACITTIIVVITLLLGG